MRSRKLLALLLCLITFPAIAGYMTLLGAGVGSIAPVVSWVSTTDPTFPSSSLSFSRTSNATMFDSTGKLTYAPNNLLLQSNTFSNAAWQTQVGGTGSAPVITSGQSDPLGGTAAWRVQFNRGAGNTTGDFSTIYQNFTSGPAAGVNLASGIWIKSNTGVSQNVMLSTYNGTTFAPVGVTATTSWQFLSPTAYASGGAAANYFYVGSRGTYNTTNSVDVLIYVATVAAVTYETTPRSQDQVITTSAAYYGPRIDYDPNTLAVKGLLIEEARTNAISASNDLSSVAWAKNGSTVTANSATGPDGQTSLAQVNKTNASNGQLYRNYSTANTKTISFYASKGSLNYVAVSMYSSIGSAFFNLNTGAVAATNNGAATVTASITAIGGGIYRCIAVFSGTFTPGELHIEPSDGTNTTQLAPWGTGGTGTINLGFVQVEEGQSFATSYIPTAASSVTRAADVVQFTGAALTALQGSAASFFVEQQQIATNAGTGNGRLSGNASGNPFFYLNSNIPKWRSNDGTDLATPTITNGSLFRTAIAWNASGRSADANGGTVVSDAKAITYTGMYLGSDGSLFINEWVKSFAIYNQRLPDATLQAKSVVGASYAANDNGLRFADNDNLPIHWRVAL